MHDVARAGEERVNGTAAVHYKGTLDQETVTLRMAKEMREKADTIRDRTGADVYATVTRYVTWHTARPGAL